MPQTTADFFLNVAEGAPGQEPWTGLTNMLATAGEATVTGVNPIRDSLTVSLTNPANAGEMGTGDTITDIRIQLNGYFDSGTEAGVKDLQIAGGNTYSQPMNQTTPTTLTWDGDLTYWGITEQQARDFVNGTEDLIFQTEFLSGSNPNLMAVVWVEVRFDYIKSQVNLPGLF